MAKMKPKDFNLEDVVKAIDIWEDVTGQNYGDLHPADEVLEFVHGKHPDLIEIRLSVGPEFHGSKLKFRTPYDGPLRGHYQPWIQIFREHLDKEKSEKAANIEREYTERWTGYVKERNSLKSKLRRLYSGK